MTITQKLAALANELNETNPVVAAKVRGFHLEVLLMERMNQKLVHLNGKLQRSLDEIVADAKESADLAEAEAQAKR